MDILFGIIMFVFAGMFCYMSCHVVEEERQGKRIRLPWELYVRTNWIVNRYIHWDKSFS